MHDFHKMPIYCGKDEYDVIVVGGGTAGSTAGIACVEEGLSTLILERNSYLGGAATGGQVSPMMYCGMPDSSSINIALKNDLKKINYGNADPFGNDGWFNPEMLKFYLEEKYTSQGGEILYDTECIDSIVENGEISGVIIHNRGGVQKLSAKMVIDCSGDAVIAYKSGVPCLKGNDIDGKNQAASLRFILGNINLTNFLEYLDNIGETRILEYPLIEIAATANCNNPLSKLLKAAVGCGLLKSEDIQYMQAFSIPGMEGVLTFNCPQIPDMHDTLNPELVSRAYVTGRKMIQRLFEFFRGNVPGFEKSYILSVASMLGVRESRRIKGKYILSEKDFNNRAKFEDAITRTAYPIDIHGESAGAQLEIRALAKGEYFEIPFRSLVPLEIENLLVGGRCISTSFYVQSSIRIEATCRATGEACGYAAAYCIKNHIKLKDLNGKIVRQLMISKGAVL